MSFSDVAFAGYVYYSGSIILVLNTLEIMRTVYSDMIFLEIWIHMPSQYMHIKRSFWLIPLFRIIAPGHDFAEVVRMST
jgi:hypothetical protein